MRLTDIQFFIINNLHVVRDLSSSGGFYGIHIHKSGSDITISNCDIDVNGTNSTLHGSIVASGDTASILVAGNFHRLTIIGNTTTSGGYGISVFGLVGNLASDIVIAENDIYDFVDNGIYLRETDGAVIRDNHFDKRTAQVSSVNAIQIAQAANINANIYNNIINVSQTANGTMTFRGIYLFNGTGHKVYNNVFTDIRLTSGNFTAIEVRTAGTAPKIYFNTISLDSPDSTAGNLYGIKEELSNTNAELRNNIISISQPSTGTKTGLVLGTTSTISTAFDTDYNNIYVPGGFTAMKGTITPTYYTALADWQAASSSDVNSSEFDPMFSTFAAPVPTNLALDNTGLALAGYTNDILGNMRSSAPDMGAYEFIENGLSKISELKSLDIYPNPVQNLLHIALPSSGTSSAELSVYSSDGRLVFAEIIANAPKSDYQLNLKSLTDGIYFIQMKSNRNLYQNKFVKLGFE